MSFGLEMQTKETVMLIFIDLQIQEPVMGGIANMPNDNLIRIFEANVLSAHRVTAALLPLLRKGKAKKVVNM